MTTALLALLLGAITPANEADVGGPLRLQNGFQFGAVFLSTPPLHARIGTRPRLDLRLSMLSTHAVPDYLAQTAAGMAQAAGGGPLDLALLAGEAAADPAATLYLADVETTRLDLVYTHPLGRRWQFEVEAPIYYQSGGWMDAVVEGWHALFGLPDTGRRGYPHGNSQMAYYHGGSSFALTGESGPALGDITLRGLWQAVDSRPAAIAFSGAVKLPTGAASRLAGSGCWDFGLGLHGSYTLGQSRVYTTAGFNHHGGWRGMSGVQVRDTLDWHLGYEYRVSEHWSWLTQVSLYGSPTAARESRSVDDPASLYAFAARYNDGRSFELEWGFVENIARNSNTHDFGIYGRVRLWP